jgi:large subunit ribosomal protein L18
LLNESDDMSVKNDARLRRARKARMKMREIGATRLTVHRTPHHMYAQIIVPASDRVLAQASTLDKSLRVGKTGNIEAAAKVGTLIAERAKAIGVTRVAFDRAGYKFHGRVKALADAARAAGLEF